MPATAWGWMAPMHSDGDVVDVADKLMAVIKHHAAAVAAGSSLRRELGPQLVDALNAYGGAVANFGGDEDDAVDDDLTEELETFDAWLGDQDGVSDDEDDDDEELLVALFVRVDIEVKDGGLLRAQALDRMQQCCPALEGEDPQDSVRSDADAVVTLVGHGDHPLSSWFETHGLEVRHEASVAVPVTSANFGADDPFALLVATLDEEAADQ